MNPTLPTSGVPTGSTSDSAGTQQRSAPADSSNGKRLREVFRKFSTVTAAAVGSPWAFAVAVAAIIVWATLGPRENYSDTWQLVINTGTTIVTFLMVFLIQNTQNRDARAIHLKLDELIRGMHSARNRLIDLEDCTDEEIAQLEAEFKRLREKHHPHAQSSGRANGKAHGNAKGNGKDAKPQVEAVESQGK
jgi:low affinity Fe/Cu permease